jgi:quinol monooxygenase YgiN
MAYGYIGSMRVQPGYRDDVVKVMTSGAGRLRDLGCLLYVVSVSDDDPDIIWTSEVWQSKGQHDASLVNPEVSEAIGAVMPMLTGEFTSQELTVVGGLGV